MQTSIKQFIKSLRVLKTFLIIISLSFSMLFSACVNKEQPEKDNTPVVHKKPIADKNTSPFGVTAGSINYYMAEIMLIDAFKQSGKWLTKGEGDYNWDSGEQAKLDLDEHGWIKSLIAKGGVSQNYNRVGKLIYHDTNGKHTAGKHIVLYEGEGEISYHLGPQKIDAESRPGRDVVDMPQNGSFLLVINRTNPDNYIRNIRVIKPGGICNTADVYAENADACNGEFYPFEEIVDSQIFHPYFVDGLKNYRLLRGMDIQATTLATFSTWEERPKLQDSSWANTRNEQGTKKGAPFEILVTYANLSNSDLWVNIPARVDNNYAKNMAAYIKANLNKNLKVYTEYFDEAWNRWGVYGETGGNWMAEQGKSRWGADTDSYTAILNWYGMRTMDFCKIFKDEFGADKNRVKCTMNSQASNTWISEQMLGCPLYKNETGKDCSTGIDYLSIAPYFGGYVGENPHWKTVANWNLDTLFQELEHGTVLNIADGGGLNRPKEWMRKSKIVADKFGVGMIAYEGGQHLVSFEEPAEGTPDYLLMEKLTDLFIRANRDSRMGDLYKKHLKDWKDEGGELFVAYTNMSQYGRYGSWGNKESRTDTNAPKAKAFEDFQIQNPCWWKDCNLNSTKP